MLIIFYTLSEKIDCFSGKGINPPPLLIGDISPKKSMFFMTLTQSCCNGFVCKCNLWGSNCKVIYIYALDFIKTAPLEKIFKASQMVFIKRVYAEETLFFKPEVHLISMIYNNNKYIQPFINILNGYGYVFSKTRFHLQNLIQLHK